MPFVMYANDYRVFAQAKQHVDFHSLLSLVKFKLVTENRCERFFNLEFFHPVLEVFPGIFLRAVGPAHTVEKMIKATKGLCFDSVQTKATLS